MSSTPSAFSRISCLKNTAYRQIFPLNRFPRIKSSFQFPWSCYSRRTSFLILFVSIILQIRSPASVWRLFVFSSFGFFHKSIPLLLWGTFLAQHPFLPVSVHGTFVVRLSSNQHNRSWLRKLWFVLFDTCNQSAERMIVKKEVKRAVFVEQLN